MEADKEILDSILEAVGNTPLVRLNRIPSRDGAQILAKLEFMNPGMSVKDRMALYIIEDAERRGLLKPGATIVENTSGNTGVGVALCAAVKGYRAVFTMPDKMSAEKVRRLRAFGAEVVVTPTNVPADHPDSYYETAKRIAGETPGAFMLNQYHNKLNIQAHYASTGAEIWRQTGGRIDAFLAGMGTGGTMSGTARFLKERRSAIRTIGVDPMGSVYFEQFHTGVPGQPHQYKVEGIGEDMVCDALEFEHIDDVYQVTDRECFAMARRLTREEGIFAGGSSGGAVHVAVAVAREMRPEQVVVVLLPDSGAMYLSKFFDDEWMEANGFFGPGPQPRVFDLIRCRPHRRVFVGRDATLGAVLSAMAASGLDRIVVADEQARPVGVIEERDLLRAVADHGMTKDAPASGFVRELVETLDWEASIEDTVEALKQHEVLFVLKDGRVLDAVTASDLARHIWEEKGGRDS